MKCKLTVIAVLALSVATSAQMRMGPGGPPPGEPHMRMAPGPGMPGMGMGEWWKNSEVVQQLKLSDAQVKQIEQSYLDSRLKLIDDNADVQKQETKLQALMSADQFHEGQVTSQIDQLLAARTRLGKDYAMMLVNVRRVLTPEQWKALQSVRGQRVRREGPEEMRRPGMMGAPQPTPAPEPRPPALEE